MFHTHTITAKSQIHALPHEAEVMVVGEYLTYMNRADGRPDSFDIAKSCQIRLTDAPVLVTVEDELRYEYRAGSPKSGKTLSRADMIVIPAKVEVVTDPLDETRYRVLVASGSVVAPAVLPLMP